MHVGIDIEQFVRQPYGSGIQRVLQYLARQWPADLASADFVIPYEGGHGLLTPAQAADVLGLAFDPRETGLDLRDLIAARIEQIAPLRVSDGDLLAIYDAWLLPEVSYLPSVLRRLELFSKCIPITMIGYDALPMTEPANYRFRPGAAAWVSEYFRQLAAADSVVCISDYARDSVLGRLRREPRLPISVAHPGGDHLPARTPELGASGRSAVFTRLGTLEARKRPLEILRGFLSATAGGGSDAELVFIGSASSSDDGINREIREAESRSVGVRWIEGASDKQVHDLVHASSAFLSVGVEGYGIPVLEAIRLGTPVLFDGIQPAGDLMIGHGARRVAAMTHEDLATLFSTYAHESTLAALRGEVDAEAVPTWAAFAREVALAVTRS